MTSITVYPANPNYTSVDGVLYSKDKAIIYAYPLGKTAATYTVPKGVKIIASFCFFGTPMTKIDLPDTLIEIHEEGFELSQIETLALSDVFAFDFDLDLKNVFCFDLALPPLTK